MAPRSNRAARAMLHVPQIDPALAALAVWCETTDAETEATFTSGDTIHIGTSFPALPLREQIGMLAHHILHIALRHEYQLQTHIARFGSDADAELHNLCADAIINECLLRAGHALPRPAVRLATLRKHLGDAALLSDEALVRLDLLRVVHETRPLASDALAYAQEHCFVSDIHPDMAALKTDRAAGQWRAHLARAAQGAGSAGRGIGKLLAHFAEVTPSHTHWDQHLRGLLAKATNPQPRRSYRRPRKRWVAAEADAIRNRTPRPVFEPSEDRNARRARLVIGIDASSSVERVQMMRFAGEVIAITQKSDAEIHLMIFDEEVFAHLRVSPANAVRVFNRLPMRRDGGTSFVEIIDRATSLDPSLIVVLTDLQGPFGHPPNVPVLWASTAAAPPAPPFGKVVELIG
ncbi:MAG: VWA-like domain-containing protein [Pseudomonadota bacterium]